MNKISVIIPTFNRLDILKKTLSAYNNQTLNSKLFQMIIVDDGSTDQTFDFLKKNISDFKFQVKIFKQKNSGPNAAREKGIKEADFPIVLITGDDMVPAENFLEEHLKYHEKYSDINCSVLGFIDWHPDVKLDSFKKYITGEGGEQFSYDDIKDVDEVTYHFFYTSNISFKRKFIEELDYIFDKDFTYPAYDDLEFGVRLWEKGLRILYNKNAVVYHHHNITIESFAKRSYFSGKMGWIYHNKQPAEKSIKSLIISCLNDYKQHTDKEFRANLFNSANEINKIDPEVFSKIEIGKSNDALSDRFKEYQKLLFQNLIVNNFACGLFDKINEEVSCYKSLNIAFIPEAVSKSPAPSCIRAIFPSVFLNVLNNVDIFYPDRINEENINSINAVFVQRSSFFNGNIIDFLRIIKKRGKKIIFDFDDILWSMNDELYKKFYFEKEKIEELVDIISVSTQNLKMEAEKFYKKPCVVIPNYIDINYFYYNFSTHKERKRLYIGIIGTPSHKEDFDFIAPVIEKISEKYEGKVAIKFWGYIPEELKNIRGIYHIPFEIDYLKYAERLRKERFDICLVPLLENRINNVKSNIKWLEFSMNKIPAIFSDVSAYETVENFKTGVKVDNNEKEWFDAISLLIEDSVMREEIKENAYREVLNNWTLQKNFHNLLNMFD